MEKQEIKAREEQLVKLTSDFCKEAINEEYAVLCEKLIRKLGRKREVPFKRGKLEVWAAAVVSAIGYVNFLSDRSSEPYLPTSKINEYFGTKESTVGSKAGEIRKMFRLDRFNPEFSTGHMQQINPYRNLVMIDGFLAPIDMLPEEYQKMLAEARDRGEDLEFFTQE